MLLRCDYSKKIDFAAVIARISHVRAFSVRPESSKRARNPRIHTDKQLRQIEGSIQSFGFNVPVLVDAGLQVIAGHGRVLASKLLGETKLPVIRLEHLSAHQIRAFMIADNRLTENGEWNDRLLGEQLRILSEAELDFDLEATGFEMGEIDVMIENLASRTFIR
jgi:ParB-like chromosome segregation protein Spo0J